MKMIEKVARALDIYLQPMSNLDIRHAAAKAAIEAMRDPTEEMTNDENVHWGYNCHVCGGPKENWQRMIDNALKAK